MRPLHWMGSSLGDLRSMPDAIQDDIGYALYVAQQGGRHESAKPLSGFKGAGVLEIVENRDGDTYRAVYTVKSPARFLSCTCSRRSPSAASPRPSLTWN